MRLREAWVIEGDCQANDRHKARAFGSAFYSNYSVNFDICYRFNSEKDRMEYALAFVAQNDC
jgi:hypothetical protein